MTESGGARAIVLFGVSGCGKTLVGRRLADELGWSFVDADDLHPPENIAKMRRGVPLDDADRVPWLAALRARIEERLAGGRSLVIACSALRRAYRDRLAVDGERVRFVYLRTRREVLERRLRRRRDHFFHPGLLDSQLRTLEEPAAEGVTVDGAAAPERVLRDIRRRLGV